MKFRRALRKIRRLLWPPGPQPLILAYHRVADLTVDPWGLMVSPNHFEEHLDVLRHTRFPMRLADFVCRLDDGTLPPNAVTVTFDDGYVDNLSNAKPRLEAAGVPATVFLATGYLGHVGEFWWDELARLIFFEGSGSLICNVRGRTLSFDLGLRRQANDAHAWRAWDAPTTARQAAYMAIWRSLYVLPDIERESAMAQIRSAFAARPLGDNPNRPMKHSEVRYLIESGLVSIGAHTVTHPALTQIDSKTRKRELMASKVACEDLAGKPTLGFAYPHGDLDSEVRSDVKDAGFAYAVSVVHASVAAASDRLALPRMQVLDWDGHGFDKAMRAAEAETMASSVR